MTTHECCNCNFMKELQDERNRVFYFCMFSHSDCFLEETGLCRACEFRRVRRRLFSRKLIKSQFNERTILRRKQMREILFRGKRVDNGEWVEGFLVKKTDPLLGIEYWFILVQEYDTSCIDGKPTHLELLMTWYKVFPETVGQYTGLCDKNGKKIFEGDIVKHYGNNEDKNIFDIGNIYWGDRDFQFRRTSRENGQYYDIGVECEYKIIGNIHDNPELLKGGATE